MSAAGAGAPPLGAAVRFRYAPLAAALVASVAFAAVLPAPRMAVLFAIGFACGLTLYHAAFGFTAAYRRLLFQRDGAGVRAQLFMLAVATVLFAPVLAAESAFGRPVTGAFAPAGVQMALGAFLFGAGMQLGGGCGSGTLYAAGGGSVRMFATLAAFCAGGFWASLHMDAWQRLPAAGELVLGAALGWPQAVTLQLAVLGALYLALRRWADAGPLVAPPKGWTRVIAGPWPLAAGALLLATLNLATLLVAGHPWSITWAFTLWGAKAAQHLGWSPGEEGFWAGDFPRAALVAPVTADVTSVMDIGIVLGALAAAGLAGRFAPSFRVPPLQLAASVLGGLAMGYGARIAFGCNIGAFFSGVASTSLHGWLWIAAALPGVWVGARLRPAFGLSV
jgi:hypothetical protein